MKLYKNAQPNRIDIWQPRWKDRTVLIAKHKAGLNNIVTFSKAKSLEGEWYVSGADIAKCPIDSNGKIACYAVPLERFQPFEGFEE